ncbi:hypothetical protein A9G28_00520 [Gilliamella sp. Fer1-1]|jgi:hypothetical protein|uniref:hypothetical protein n=1 Tax=Gilliamella sp. Fer1-1 TaxID=3120240 RepID=UPI00080E9F94|nr:hypothetical protein [Gilliamella apicola]OCG44466.1 hypothetical protein A9G28_00520 [Gilliamella apicola]
MGDKEIEFQIEEAIGYIIHNVSQSERFDEPKKIPLSNMKRVLDSELPPLAHWIIYPKQHRLLSTHGIT